MVLESEAQVLKSFARAMGDIDISGVRTGRIERFFHQKKPVHEFRPFHLIRATTCELVSLPEHA
jgi:hypothetical protein